MGAEDRKIWEKRQRENRIIDLAEPLFFKKGYEGATIIEIAHACGYNKRSIYLYFKDKEEIFLAVVLRGLNRLHDVLEAVSHTTDIRDLGRAFFEFSLSYPDYLKLIMVYESTTCVYRERNVREAPASNDPVSSDRASPGIRGGYREKCQAATDAVAALITEILAKAISEKQIHTGLTPEQLMLILWGQVFGVMQVILMRRRGFEQTYGISYKALFNVFLDMTVSALSRDGVLRD